LAIANGRVYGGELADGGRNERGGPDNRSCHGPRWLGSRSSATGRRVLTAG
jgi:hypothetical protein